MVQINNVKASSFKINYCNNNVLINFDKELRIYNDEGFLINSFKDNNPKITFILECSSWVGFGDTYETIVYDENLNQINKLNFIATSWRNIENFKSNKYLYPTLYIKNKERCFAKISKEDYSIVKIFEDKLGYGTIYLVIDDTKFLSLDNDNLAVFNYDNEIIWQLSFSELLQDETSSLNSEVLEINNKLYFVALGSESGGLFCLDVNSGKVLMHYPRVSRFLVKDENYIYSSKYENILCKINPITYEMEEWDVNQLIKDNGFENIHDHRCTADKGLVYFTQTLGDNKAKFGILDTNKKELIYKYEFEPKNGGIGSIQVSNDRIFISTQDNTLHIFETDK